MDLDKIKKMHDKAYTFSQTTRERASDDLVFYWVTQWDDNILQESQLAYRGEFNILRKAGRGILSDLAANPVQVDFEPVDEGRDDAADVVDGLYRSDNQSNTSIEAFSNAEQEMVICGMGAWELYTEYESLRSDDNNQVIKRRPIPEANNTVFFDPNAKLLDKSDATYCSVLTAYTEDGYRDLVEELTGERPDQVNSASFKSPEQSYVFPWIGVGTTPTIYISTFYHRKLVKTKIITMLNPVGQEIKMYESDLKDVMDDMIDSGFEIVSEKETKRWRITKYIVSGEEILSDQVISGEYIPVIPSYGERAIIEGEEHWEGVTRLTKDPQRLRNFQMSYLADIVSQSPRPKPIFNAEQIAGHEAMYALNGSDNNYPYLLQNRVTESGELLTVGPVAVMPEQPIPTALTASIALSRQAVEDVANPGVPQDIADPDLSGKAVLALQSKLDMQSMVYQEHLKHAKRHDGIVWVSIASEVYDVPRTISVELKDGTRKKTKVMEQVFDNDTGELVTLNDIYNVEFKVFSTIGPSYNSQKEQTIDRLEKIMVSLPPADPMFSMVMLSLLKLQDGVDLDDVRKYANKQLILGGFKDPETDEEKQMLADEQQKPKEPSAEMLMGMGENKKGEAALLEQKRKGIEMQLTFQNKDTANEISGFNAQTQRMNTQIDAQEAGADINMKKIETFGKEIDNEVKLKELIQPINMTDDELMAELTG